MTSSFGVYVPLLALSACLFWPAQAGAVISPGSAIHSVRVDKLLPVVRAGDVVTVTVRATRKGGLKMMTASR